MAVIWTEQIILGNKKFSQVPRLLKESVRELLIARNREDLIDE